MKEYQFVEKANPLSTAEGDVGGGGWVDGVFMNVHMK